MFSPTYVYVHIPFCVRKCLYCDFVSVRYDSSLAEDYLTALEKEIRNRFSEGIIAQTLYIGGGTPTSFSSRLLESLFKKLYSKIHLTDGAEVSIECNPGTLNKKKARLLRKLGVNRISLGVQSFRNRNLKILGRIHDGKEALESLYLLQDAGFQNINLDLIYGLPGQNLKEWKEDLKKVVSLEPQHISAYELTIEEKTMLCNQILAGKFQLPDEKLTARMFVENMHFLSGSGYKHYEVSNYAKEGFECRHNLAYWRYLPYVGLGASAVSFDGSSRKRNISDVKEYIKAAVSGKNLVEEDYRISPYEGAVECLVLGLRTSEGVAEKHLIERTGFSFSDFSDSIEHLKSEGFITQQEGRIVPTEKGFLYHNTLSSLIE